MTSLQRSLDAAIRAENRRAVDDIRASNPMVPYFDGYALKYPPGTPEYEAYAKELREELAKWVAGTGEYAYTETESTPKTEED